MSKRTLQLIESEVKSCTKCDLSKTRTNTVFSRGNPSAPLVFIGEAPGADEDEQGLPFVGRAGKMLDRMIASVGLDRDKDVYVANICKCRPPGNRRPTPVEISECFPYLRETLEIISPKVIVALGNTAVTGLLKKEIGITKIRGTWQTMTLPNGNSVAVMPTYHPSYLLRNGAPDSEPKKQAAYDLHLVMQKLKG